jgi:hypothetical protein
MKFRFQHEDLRHDHPMEELQPFNGHIQVVGFKERFLDFPGNFINVNLMDAVSAAPKVYRDIPHTAFVVVKVGELVVNITLEDIG